jgi:DNA-binding MarR family transcriptional regulator
MTSNKKLHCTTIGCKMAYAVKGTIRLMQQRFTESRVNLTMEQFFVLNILDNEEGLILQDLAEIVDKDKSAVLRHIDGLEEHHYVARSKDPDDGRRKLLLITKKGIKQLDKAEQVAERVNDELTDHIPATKLDEYQKHIDIIYEKAIALAE